MKSYLPGIDYAWLAVDRADHVALCFTGGAGPFPGSAIDLAPADDAQELVEQLAPSSGVIAHITYPGMDDFVLAASRGLYVFDWTDVHRSEAKYIGMYELVVEPVQPLKVHQLPTRLQVLARFAALNGVSFSSCTGRRFKIE